MKIDRPDTHLFAGSLWTNVPVQIDGLPESFELFGTEWHRKKEFHVTLINGEYVAEVVGGDLDTEKLRKIFEESCQDVNFKVTSVGPKLSLAEIEGRRSLVIFCTLQGLEKVYTNLEQQFGIVGIERPPTHITLYTLDNALGIALSTQKHLEERTKPLLGESLEQLKWAINYEKVLMDVF